MCLSTSVSLCACVCVSVCLCVCMYVSVSLCVPVSVHASALSGTILKEKGRGLGLAPRQQEEIESLLCSPGVCPLCLMLQESIGKQNDVFILCMLEMGPIAPMVCSLGPSNLAPGSF